MTDSALVAYIRKALPDLIALYRFGSTTRDRVRPDSDIDLAFLSRGVVSELCRFELAQDLAIQFHRDIDLVDLRSASTVMRMQILSTGTCLTAEDEGARRVFEMYVYSDYARLNEERRELLKGITKRGLVYG